MCHRPPGSWPGNFPKISRDGRGGEPSITDSRGGSGDAIGGFDDGKAKRRRILQPAFG
ncbi:hypothetical protein [Amycolatopsis echigonensis]|uniref:hypothetical protein n=1 Tax=Amycolatopsis echigonensis TaxID=2576905 RepID=UPI001304E5C2|nr:hypothetical protein [Amycolatopsis niigatensis]